MFIFVYSHASSCAPDVLNGAQAPTSRHDPRVPWPCLKDPVIGRSPASQAFSGRRHPKAADIVLTLLRHNRQNHQIECMKPGPFRKLHQLFKIIAYERVHFMPPTYRAVLQWETIIKDTLMF